MKKILTVEEKFNFQWEEFWQIFSETAKSAKISSFKVIMF